MLFYICYSLYVQIISTVLDFTYHLWKPIVTMTMFTCASIMRCFSQGLLYRVVYRHFSHSLTQSTAQMMNSDSVGVLLATVLIHYRQMQNIFF